MTVYSAQGHATGESFFRKPFKAEQTHTQLLFPVKVLEGPCRNLFTLNKITSICVLFIQFLLLEMENNMYMYSEVYVRYVFGFVLIISLRLDRRRQRSFCQSWKLESLAAP